MGTGEGIPRRGSFDVNFMQQFQREKQALTTCLLVFITNIATTTLIYITSALRSRDEIYEQIPLEVHFLATYFFLLGTVLDPLVIMRTRDFREKLACCKRKAGIHGTVSKALRNVIDLGISDESSTKMTNSSSTNRVTDTSTHVNSNDFTSTSNGTTSSATDTESHTEC